MSKAKGNLMSWDPPLPITGNEQLLQSRLQEALARAQRAENEAAELRRRLLASEADKSPQGIEERLNRLKELLGVDDQQLKVLNPDFAKKLADIAHNAELALIQMSHYSDEARQEALDARERLLERVRKAESKVLDLETSHRKVIDGLVTTIDRQLEESRILKGSRRLRQE